MAARRTALAASWSKWWCLRMSPSEGQEEMSCARQLDSQAQRLPQGRAGTSGSSVRRLPRERYSSTCPCAAGGGLADRYSNLELCLCELPFVFSSLRSSDVVLSHLHTVGPQAPLLSRSAHLPIQVVFWPTCSTWFHCILWHGCCNNVSSSQTV